MNYFENEKGWIECICGPMFSGKTEELLKRIKRMQYSKKKYLVFKPQMDSRYSTCEIVSHNQEKVPAITISHGSDIRRYLNDNKINTLTILPLAYNHSSIFGLYRLSCNI